MIRSKICFSVQGNGKINKDVRIKDKADILDFYVLLVDEIFNQYNNSKYNEGLKKYMIDVIVSNKI